MVNATMQRAGSSERSEPARVYLSTNWIPKSRVDEVVPPGMRLATEDEIRARLGADSGLRADVLKNHLWIRGERGAVTLMFESMATLCKIDNTTDDWLGRIAMVASSVADAAAEARRV